MHHHEFLIISFQGYQYASPFPFRVSTSFVTLLLVSQSLYEFSVQVLYIHHLWGWQAGFWRVAEGNPKEHMAMRKYHFVLIMNRHLQQFFTEWDWQAAWFPTEPMENQSQNVSRLKDNPIISSLHPLCDTLQRQPLEAITAITSFVPSFCEVIKSCHWEISFTVRYLGALISVQIQRSRTGKIISEQNRLKCGLQKTRYRPPEKWGIKASTSL